MVERHADVAQLVEHHLAKVGVAGSNPVVRSRSEGVSTPEAPSSGHSLGHTAGPQGAYRGDEGMGMSTDWPSGSNLGINNVVLLVATVIVAVAILGAAFMFTHKPAAPVPAESHYQAQAACIATGGTWYEGLNYCRP